MSIFLIALTNSESFVLNISFLDEQYLEIEDNTNEKRKSGLIGNLKRWHPAIYAKFKNKKISLEDAINESQNIAKQSHTDSTPIADQSQNIADKKREDKIRLEKIRQKNRVYAIENCLPTDNQKNDFEDFLSYWFEIGINDKKHKFEKQKSFDWVRRWNTWLKNNEKWQKEKSSAKKENNFSISQIEV